MLVITRRAGESILLGNEIRIVILGVESDRIKIGIEAPQSMKILRAELISEVGDINREATRSDLSLIQDIRNQRPAVSPACAPDAGGGTQTLDQDRNPDDT